MPAPRLADAAADRVGDFVVAAFADVLKERLVCLTMHGSAVTGYLPGFSDFDFVPFMHGRLELTDSIQLQAQLGAKDIEPFTYLQVSRVLDVDAPGELRTGLIDGAHVELYGSIPPGWIFLSEDDLRASGREVLVALQQGANARYENWAVEGGAQRKRRVRWFMTDVKPATRALLVELHDPVFEVWRANYWELARRMRAHDADLATRLDAILRAIPPAPDNEPALGNELLLYLEEVGRRARALGIS